MKVRLIILTALIIGSCVGLPVNADAYEIITLGFEDLGPGQHDLPADYAGLTWGDRWVYYDYLQWPLDPCSSGPVRVFYGPWIDFGKDITFLGSWVGTLAWGGDKYWLGYNDGELVYESPHLTADEKKHGWIDVYWPKVDYVEFVGGFGSYAIDDIRYISRIVIKSKIEIVPNTLNLHSKGTWITSYVWLPEDYDVADVDSSSILLEDEIEAEWIWADEEEQVVMVKFLRSEVQEMLAELDQLGQVELTVSGELTNGTLFVGTDTIRVIE